ncbi:MAG: M1 family metallopeptidase [Bacteroidota bacterium]
MYFQQQVNYKIDVELNDKSHILNAFINIEYINNSPDTLKYIYFHFWPNAYKNNKTALAKQLRENGELKMEFLKPSDSGWIDSLNFETNGIKLKLEYDKKNIDIAKLILDKPLPPTQKITLSTPFRVKLPSARISRLGHIGQAYAITQWYPKPAVYDNKGWHPIPYLDQGEFYSEYGNFEVEITLPENYVVGATGDMVENQNELSWLELKINQTKSKIQKREELKKLIEKDKSILIDTLFFPKSSSIKKTLVFKQQNVHDFAWFADKRFNVIKDEVELPHTKNTVTCWSLFTDNNFDLWLNSPEYLKDATYYYSLWNGDYPYKQVTAVDGTISAGGGMEYPNITIIGETENEAALENVIMHEVGHNWFYGILGSNERNHAWMDEGINSFNELRYTRTKYPQGKFGEQFGISTRTKLVGLNKLKNTYQYYLLYAKGAIENKDQPIELNSEKYTESNYGAIVYSKTAVVMDYLYHYLGDTVFDKCMKEYFEKYKFKHPQPENLREIFETNTTKNLSWFFDDLINTTKKIDYSIKGIRKSKSNLDLNKYVLKLKNKGGVNSPLVIGSLSKENNIKYYWIEGFNGRKKLEIEAKNIKEFRIDPEYYIPEKNRKNNFIKTSGILKKRKPYRIKFIGSIDNPETAEINYLPVVGYNNNNGWMAGLNLSNYFLFERKLQFDVTPLYSFGSKELAGTAKAELNFHFNKIFKTVNSSFRIRKFAFERTDIPLNFYKLDNTTSFIFKNQNPRSRIENKLIFRLAQIGTETQFYNLPDKKIDYRSIGDLIFFHNNKQVLHPYNIQIRYQTGNPGNLIFSSETFSKISLEANFHITTDYKNNGFDVRIFAGKMLNQIDQIDTRFRMGGIYGYQDYAFDYLYFDRNAQNGINLQQFIEEEGAFKTRMFLGQSNSHLIALNLKSPKFKKFIGLFADLGTCGDDGLLNNKVLADMGINFDFFNQSICVYLPLFYSKDIKSGIVANDWSFGERIMISMRLDRLNPKSLFKGLVDF